MNMRKRTDLEVKFDTFLENHWLHMVREVAGIQGQLKILIGMVMGLCAFVVGVWAVEVLRLGTSTIRRWIRQREGHAGREGRAA